VKRGLRVIAGMLAALGLGVLLLTLAVLQMLRAAPGEWSQPLRLGPWQVQLGMPAVLRMVTHPFVLHLLEGRTWRTPHGLLTLRAGAQPGTWEAECAPCLLGDGSAGGTAVRVSRLRFTLRRSGQNDPSGELVLGRAPHEWHGHWNAHLGAQGAELGFSLTEVPLSDAYALFADDIPELRRARIEGRIRTEAKLRLPAREWRVVPHVEGFAVSGLGTEILLDAVPACDPGRPGRGFGTWLPRAVIAAEDQRFQEHTGFDLAEITAAFESPGSATRGASTLSQQLAKLVFTGDDRSHVRKLRELLYAVELDRTLGKARVLNLYLGLVPWGEGQCGAHAAARRYFAKRADALTPIEAAWLASLLHNPDRELAAMARSGGPDIERVGWIIGQLRPMARARREALLEALPAWSPR
jgi:hypothetical protein